MAYLKTLAECTYALLYGYGSQIKRWFVDRLKRFQRWSNEPKFDEDEFL